MNNIKIKVEDKKFIPKRAKENDVGYDIRSTILRTIPPGEVAIIPCGFSIEIPLGYEAQIRTRSGLATKGIIVANSPGTIDPGFRGTVCIILANISSFVYYVYPEDRIAQIVFNKVELPEIEIVEELSESDRGEGGLGHTGK